MKTPPVMGDANRNPQNPMQNKELEQLAQRLLIQN
jgi:hypothetical protein